MERKKNINFSYLILMFGTIISLVIGFYLNHREYQIWKEKVQVRVDHLTYEMDERVVAYKNTINGIISFFDSSQFVDRNEFRSFVTPLIKRNNYIKVIGYDPVITDKKRDIFEKSVRQEGFSDFQIKSRSSDGTMRASPKAEIYIPVNYLYPFEGNEKAFGYNLYSNEKRRRAILLARDTGQSQASEPVILVQEKEGKYSSLIFTPIYHSKNLPESKKERKRLLKGMISSVVRVDDLIKRILPEEIQNIPDFEVFDKDIKIKSFRSGNKKSNFQVLTSLPVFGRSWEFRWNVDKTFLGGPDTRIGRISSSLLFLIFLTFFLIFKIFEQKSIQEKKSSKAKTDFLTRMSHEIRTPLNGIIGNIELLQKSPLSKSQKEFLSDIETSGNRLKGIITDILDFSQIEQGKLQSIKNTFNIKKLVEGTFKILEKEILEKGNSFNLNISPEIPLYLEGDERFLGQVLLNLINNSNKFCKNGSLSVELVQKDKVNENIKIEFVIKDTGIGISSNLLKHVFDAFIQVDKNDFQNPGIGIGLAVSKELVSLMGGELMVESIVDVGSKFSFDLLFKEGNKTEVKIKSKDYENLHNEYPIKIMIVEDDLINQRMGVRFLKKWGFNPVVANNGLEAFEFCKEQEFDLILMDIQMPVMGGIESSEKILEFRKSKPPVIVALTADATIENRKNCFDAGLKDFITKPFKKAEIIEVIIRYGHKNKL